MFLDTLSQSPTQNMYALAKIALLDERVGPHYFHQFVFSNNLTPALNQHEKNIQGFGRKLNRLLPP
jgi:hypothetical protein